MTEWRQIKTLIVTESGNFSADKLQDCLLMMSIPIVGGVALFIWQKIHPRSSGYDTHRSSPKTAPEAATTATS